MRADDEVVVVDLEVTNGRHRQVELQRLPRVAVVDRDERAALGAAHEQAATLRVFLDGVDVNAGGQAIRDRLPGPAEVARPVDVRVEVLQLVAVHAGIRGVRIEMRRFHLRHPAP